MIHFVVHEEGDGVGVVVVEGVKAGQPLSGWIMEDDQDIEVVAKSDRAASTTESVPRSSSVSTKRSSAS